MAHRANKRPPGRIKSSIVARLNTRLFFRLLGIYFTMDLLLLFLFCGGLFVWSEQQAAQISTLVEERGVPSLELMERAANALAEAAIDTAANAPGRAV